MISRTEAGRDSIWRLDTAAGSAASPAQVMEGQSMRNAQWAGPDKFVYASHLDTRNSIMLAGLSGAGNTFDQIISDTHLKATVLAGAMHLRDLVCSSETLDQLDPLVQGAGCDTGPMRGSRWRGC